jgi:hypothetical protein
MDKWDRWPDADGGEFGTAGRGGASAGDLAGGRGVDLNSEQGGAERQKITLDGIKRGAALAALPFAVAAQGIHGARGAPQTEGREYGGEPTAIHTEAPHMDAPGPTREDMDSVRPIQAEVPAGPLDDAQDAAAVAAEARQIAEERREAARAPTSAEYADRPPGGDGGKDDEGDSGGGDSDEGTSDEGDSDGPRR